jgi:metal-responsive CopG/Arc/MetJ family transcriptional regulator
MNHDQPTEPITIRTAKQIISEIDALAAAMDRSRNYVVNQALRQYLETNAWQIERIKAGGGGVYRHCGEAWLEALMRLVFAEPAARP